MNDIFKYLIIDPNTLALPVVPVHIYSLVSNNKYEYVCVLLLTKVTI